MENIEMLEMSKLVSETLNNMEMLTDEDKISVLDALTDMGIELTKNLSEFTELNEETFEMCVLCFTTLCGAIFILFVYKGLNKDMTLCILKTIVDLLIGGGFFNLFQFS